MHRFFVSPQAIGDTTLQFGREESHHIEKVLRLEPGDAIEAFDGEGQEYSCILLERGTNGWIAQILSRQFSPNEPGMRVHLVQGLAKGDKMEYIIQKAVEIGIYSIIPFQCDHAVVRLDEQKAFKKVERWQSIAREACKQCRRSYIPRIHMPQTLEDLTPLMKDNPWLMFYEKEHDRSIRRCLHEERLLSSQDIFLMIGPEGGFSDYEAEWVRRCGGYTAHLGRRILRTETAGLVAASIVLYESGDMEMKEDS